MSDAKLFLHRPNEYWVLRKNVYFFGLENFTKSYFRKGQTYSKTGCTIFSNYPIRTKCNHVLSSV